MDRRRSDPVNHLFLATLTGILINVCCAGDQPTLKEAFKDHFLMGTALNEAQLAGRDAKSMALVEKHFNSLTPENQLKWEKVHPRPTVYDFTLADSLVAYGARHQMHIAGHVLVWHNQTPGWVFKGKSGKPASRKVLLRRLKEHIMTVVGRYKGRIDGWDVLNEALEDNGQLKQSQWMQIIGEDYIRKSFEWAHEADPEAELYYNDFNMWRPDKRQGVVRMVSNLQAEGVPIHGIGMQGHWGLDYPPLDELEASIRAYADLGLKVMITELDMDILPLPSEDLGARITLDFKLRKELNPWPEALPDSMQIQLADRYQELFQLLARYSDVISRVTFWGVHDGASWRNHWPVRGRSAYPLLFDDSCQPKPAFEAVIKAAGSKN
ncbi:MAG: endo-1,4-beta-xylanase [Fidelibacterota bacterium]|nr:MAG: endo-1,4-beta-xylanase [Candidatus Neomarinimicrobiota bacterium]